MQVRHTERLWISLSYVKWTRPSLCNFCLFFYLICLFVCFLSFLNSFIFYLGFFIVRRMMIYKSANFSGVYSCATDNWVFLFFDSIVCWIKHEFCSWQGWWRCALLHFHIPTCWNRTATSPESLSFITLFKLCLVHHMRGLTNLFNIKNSFTRCLVTIKRFIELKILVPSGQGLLDLISCQFSWFTAL